MRHTALFVAMAAALAVGLPAPSTAASPPASAAEASKHFDRGVKLVDDEDWAGALVEFERAYEIFPNYRVLFDIAQCRYQLHDYPGALKAFQRYLADGNDAIPPDRRAKVESDVDGLKGRVASLRVTSSVAGAEVSVDDAVVGTTPLSEPIAVSAGRHKITVRRQGWAAASREVALAGEEVSEVALDPISPAAAASMAAAPMEGPPRAGSGPTLLPAWVAFGLGGAAAAAAAYFGVAALEDKNQLQGQCTGKVCPPSSQALISTSQRDALISTIGTSVAAAGVTVGVVYIALARREQAPSAPHAGILLGPGWLGVRGTLW
jgi:hypothetical protein